MNQVIGNVFYFYLAPIQRYGACQIVNELTELNLITVAVFDWYGINPPSIEEIQHCQLLKISFYFWGDLLVRNVSLPIPSDYHYLGNFEPKELLTSSYYNYHDWGFSQILIRQWQWNQLPKAMTKRFRDNIKNKNFITTAGLIDKFTNQPARERMSGTSTFDESRFIVTQDFSLQNLEEWALLSNLQLNSWHDDLFDFLKNHPIISDLTLHHHQQTALNFSQSNLSEINIDVENLQQLILPNTISCVNFYQAEKITEPLDIQAMDCGRNIEILSNKVIPKTKGLQNSHTLKTHYLDEVDIADIVQDYPNVKELWLFGNVGNIKHIEQLALLKQLEFLLIHDLFGYEAKDFPTPDLLPSLKYLELESLDENVASYLKKIYKKTSISLTIKKPRKIEWLEKNRENPFRAWDGDEQIPKIVAKKIGESYLRF